MSDPHPQSALREWRRQMLAPPTLWIVCGVAVVLALAGPFGTDQRLGLAARFGYWLVLVTTTYGAGALISAAVEPSIMARPFWVRVAVMGGLATLSTAFFVIGTNYLVFDWLPEGADWPVFLGTLLAITCIVTATIQVVVQHSHAAPTDSQPPSAPAPPPILERLPLDKRGSLLALSVEDHYVRVRTIRGEELILMRLSDAIREVGDTNGAQVHRSHWAAFDQVTSARREGDRAILTLADGTEVPVSRANLSKIKEAGLLPR